MSAHISADQTADGWVVTVEGVESVTVTTSASGVAVTFSPDDDDHHGKPLDVALGQPKSDQ